MLDGAEGNETEKILSAINNLNAGGSTAGAEGIELAYKLANEYYIEGGNNRVILARITSYNVCYTKLLRKAVLRQLVVR